MDQLASGIPRPRTEKDLLMMESIAVPLSFLVLVAVLGGLLAAALPVFVSELAIFGSMAALRAITFCTDVSIFRRCAT